VPIHEKSPGVARAGQIPQQNHLLAALPAGDYERLVPHLELIPLKLGEVLYEPGVRLRYVYFPTTSIVSLLYVMEDGASAEIAIVGNEGISAYRCSWAVKRRPVAPSCRARVTATG
jgi:hypothetical protein